jgi:hypothetical protein
MKLTDDERKFIVDVLRLLEGLRRKLKDMLDK